MSKPIRRGFPSLPCPMCGVNDGVTIHLMDLTGDEALYCTECEGATSLASVRDIIARWQAVLAWVDMAPALED